MEPQLTGQMVHLPGINDEAFLSYLMSQAVAEYKEMKPFITNTINKGKNEWGFNERTLVLSNGSNWDYIPEDNLYELNVNSTISVVDEGASRLYNMEGLRYVSPEVGYVDQDEEYY